MKLGQSFLLAAATTVVFGSAFAQNSPSVTQAYDKLNLEALSNQIGAGDLTRPSSSPKGGIQLNAGTDSNQATVKIGLPITHDGHNSWSITASSPMSTGSSSDGGSSTNNSNLATLDGLANGASLKFQWSYFGYLYSASTPDTRSADQIKADALDACKMAEKKTCKGPDYPLSDVITKYGGNKASGISGADAYKEYNNTYTSAVSAWDAGIQGGPGYNNFIYYDATTFDKTTKDDIPWEVKAYFGYLPSLADMHMITASVDFQHSYKSAQTATKCPLPAATSTSLSCTTGAFAAPTQVDKVLLALDDHLQLDIWGATFGFGPQLTYDAKNYKTGVDFPVYFIQDAKSNLIGGLRFGWTNDKSVTSSHGGFSVGVTVGAPFSIL